LAARHGVADRLDLRAPLRPEDIPEALGALRPAFGLALIQPVCLSYRLSLPNKLYEYALDGVERRLNPAREAAVVPSVVGMMLAVVAGFVRS
jgi:hypothetical protein